ncbi:MAG: LamG domain-containing protein [Lachnospiraceae bacterium]|nr:LamG domain-containing protein [Lachnospiraceae bacterium]
MKKKFLSLLLTGVMAAAVLAGCAKEETPAEPTAEPAVEEPAATEEPAAETAEIPTDYKYYFSLDGGEEGVHMATKGDGATIELTGKDPVYVTGAKGQGLYLDGTAGAKLDVNGVGDTYSVSYWMYSSRNAQHMPTLQYGPDVHGDATGKEHWVNFTWEPFNPDDTTKTTFPIVWSYDQATGGDRMYWYPDWIDNRTGEWLNITMTVDPSEVSADGSMIIAHLYLNGEEVIGTSSDGDRPVQVVTGTMTPSDNFDFLLGVNYWDTPFKGVFDEVYVYDRVLTAAEAKALFEAGDTTAKFEAPERVVEIVKNEAALETVGTDDLSMAFWSDWSSAIPLKDGETKTIVLKNYSAGGNAYENYVLDFTNQPHEAHVDPNTVEGNTEYVVVRADEWAWIGDINPDSENAADYFESTHSWGNWPVWQQSVMVDATVTLKITRNGSAINVVADNVDYNGESNLMTYTVKQTALTDADDLYVTILGEHCYIEILEINDPIAVDENALSAIGNIDLTCGFWSDWTDAYAIKDGETKTIKLNNYSTGKEDYHNFVMVLTNKETVAHSAPADQFPGEYMEYAVVRADGWGWGAPEGDANAAPDCYNIGTKYIGDNNFRNIMKAADVEIVATRNGGEVTLDMTYTSKKTGDSLTESYVLKNGNMAADSEMYFFFTNEASYVELLSVE